jgi:cold shock CspA family protein
MRRAPTRVRRLPANLPVVLDWRRIVAQGVVKVYDPKTGFGVVVTDTDQSEVLLRPGSLANSIFRTLRQGQRINFQISDQDGSAVASGVRIGSDGY